jgi:hypothetical protein
MYFPENERLERGVTSYSGYGKVKIKLKLKFALEQAMKAQKEGINIA